MLPAPFVRRRRRQFPAARLRRLAVPPPGSRPPVMARAHLPAPRAPARVSARSPPVSRTFAAREIPFPRVESRRVGPLLALSVRIVHPWAASQSFRWPAVWSRRTAVLPGCHGDSAPRVSSSAQAHPRHWRRVTLQRPQTRLAAARRRPLRRHSQVAARSLQPLRVVLALLPVFLPLLTRPKAPTWLGKGQSSCAWTQARIGEQTVPVALIRRNVPRRLCAFAVVSPAPALRSGSRESFPQARRRLWSRVPALDVPARPCPHSRAVPLSLLEMFPFILICSALVR